MHETDLYEVLGVSPNSDQVVIKAAYKAMMLKYHPDTNNDPDNEARAKSINEAFSILSDPDKRRVYDQSRSTFQGYNTEAKDPASPSPNEPPSRPSQSNGQEPVNKLKGKRQSETTLLTITGLLATGLIITFLLRDDRPDTAELALTSSTPSAPRLAQPSPLIEEVESDTSIAQTIPTIAQTDETIDQAAKEYARVLTTSGVSGAERYSRGCRAAAIASQNILDTDFCVAFDMAAMVMDYGVSQSTGASQNSYFQTRADTLDSDYARFPQAGPRRTQIIWAQVNDVLDEHIQSAIAN